jgi:hypothetical protein
MVKKKKNRRQQEPTTHNGGESTESCDENQPNNAGKYVCALSVYSHGLHLS